MRCSLPSDELGLDDENMRPRLSEPGFETGSSNTLLFFDQKRQAFMNGASRILRGLFIDYTRKIRIRIGTPVSHEPLSTVPVRSSIQGKPSGSQRPGFVR